MNVLLDGLNNLSLPGGAMGRWITGVEAVLADGTVVRAGTGGVVDGWFARRRCPTSPGCSCRRRGRRAWCCAVASSSVPKPAHRTRWFAFCWRSARPTRYAGAARTGSVDDVGLHDVAVGQAAVRRDA